MLLDGPYAVEGDAGAFYITDAPTLALHAAELTAHVVDRPAGVPELAGNAAATVALRFDSAEAAKTLLGALFPPPPPEPRQLPAEVKMYRIRIMLRLTGEMEHAEAFVQTLPEPDRTVADELLQTGDTLLTGEAFAQGFKAYRGWTDEQFEALIWQAEDLAL